MVWGYGLLNVLSAARAELWAASLEVVAGFGGLVLLAAWQEWASAVCAMRHTVKRGCSFMVTGEAFSWVVMVLEGTRLMEAQ